ncbi:MarR family winged helix-turn-helix transcriptional regulator [Streptomyces sp. NPDC056296]|uniref:MarR family winged helix-turn-helix transcriptional regulator n=1 Tax=Streptomyces sp. NPDC056296 TaxID=3345775 RepID=UPI0035DC6E3D
MPDSSRETATPDGAAAPDHLDSTSLMMDAVFRLERAVVRLQNQRLRSWNMTLSGYAALRVLADRPELSLAQLARRCHVRPQTMARIVANLEERGLMERSPHPESERAISLMLTPEGQTTLSGMTQEISKISADLGDVLTDKQAAELNNTLRACASTLESRLRHLS